MQPFALTTDRLLLDQPTRADVDDIAQACTDPLFERFMTTPWPYERHHAEFFVDEFVPNGWATDLEWTWALRESGEDRIRGMISIRLHNGMVGFWLDGARRGRGYMVEALGAVVDATFTRTELDAILWECRVGNVSSMRVAQKAGFWFTGEKLGLIPSRDGVPHLSWTGALGRDDDRAPKEGWPAGA